MSATAGTSLSGLTGVSTPSIVGQVNPEWDINGTISDKLRGYILRVDAGPTGLNAAEAMPPDVIDEFRRMINAGVVRPKNEAASNYARAQGGLRAGDQTLLGPMIDGMPEGLTPEYWAVVIQKAQQVANERLAIMNETGYFEGVPTMDRTRMEADITNQIAQTEIARRLADNTIRSTDMDEAYRRDNMAQQMRQNIIEQFGYDPGPQGAAGAAAGNQQASMAGPDGQMTPPIPGSNGPGMPGSTPGGPGQVGQAQTPNMTMKMGEQVGWQYVPGSGWQQTIAGQAQDLSEQQQAFAQQQAQAALASNPRNYIEAQMLGSSRGGLGGMAANNQVTPTTQTPQTWGQQTLPGAQIGQNVGQYLPQGQQAPQMQALQDGQTEQAQVVGGTATPEQQAQRAAMMGQAPGQANLGQGQQPNPAAMGFQAPGVAGAGMQGIQGMAAPAGQQRAPGTPIGPTGMPQQTAANQVGISAFANALNRNRIVPGSGAMQGQGAFKTMQQIGQETNPQKWRTQDFMRGNFSERQGAMGTASAAGFSDEDTQDMLKRNLPTFKAPGAGAMV